MKKVKFEINSVWLHIFAMSFMLLDHMWATLFLDYDWMTCVGRIAFPIFAFMTVEGYMHTSNLKKYITRLLITAVISEIPFNLMVAGTWIYPYHQNVIWTFLIGLMLIHFNELARKKEKPWLNILVAVATTLLGVVLGILSFSDYNAAGVLTVLVFYFLREKKWWNLLIQLALLYYINVEYLKGYCFDVTVFGKTFTIVQQGFALLSLAFIWLYKGKQGKKNKAFQYFCYAFYPLHMVILWLLMTCL